MDSIDNSSYFDLQKRAALAVNCLTELLDRDHGYLPYFDLLYWTRPPLAMHVRWDYGDCTGRYVDAIALMRIMSRSRLNEDADSQLEKLLVSLLGPRGLSWWPVPPYRTPNPADAPGQVAELCWSQASTLQALTTLYLTSGDIRHKEMGARLVDGLSGLTLLDDGMRFFPIEASTGIGRPDDILYGGHAWSDKRMLRAGWFAAFVGALIGPLARFYEATGYEPAAELAQGLCEYVLRGAKLFRSDGRFYDSIHGHFYGRATTALGILRTGLVLDCPEYVQMAESIYVHAREWGTGFGWFPEEISSIHGCETCCVTAMVEMAIVLGSHVDPAYWNDAETFGRNQLFENQLLRIDWIDRLSEDPGRIPPDDPLRITRDRVMERMRGGFAGWSELNDWVSPDKGRCHMMGCCNAQGARGLYDLWHYATTASENGVSVNMLFGRITGDVEVKSRLPYEGKIEIRVKTGKPVRVRIPSYVEPVGLGVMLNEKPLCRTISGQWLDLSHLAAGDAVTLEFSLPERSEEVFLGYETYRVRYRGDTVVEIDPPGTVYPIYDRRKLLEREDVAVADPLWTNQREIDSI